MAQFRFMEFDIWKDAIVLNDQLFDLADALSDARSYRVAEQLRAASLSISNNIAEGSGSSSSKDFSNFLNIARRSVYETANISFVAYRRKFLDKDKLNQILNDLEKLSKKITSFRKTVMGKNVEA
jgi:four helix bundle protein